MGEKHRTRNKCEVGSGRYVLCIRPFEVRVSTSKPLAVQQAGRAGKWKASIGVHVMFDSSFTKTALKIEKQRRKRMGTQRKDDDIEIPSKKEGVPKTETRVVWTSVEDTPQCCHERDSNFHMKMAPWSQCHRLVNCDAQSNPSQITTTLADECLFPLRRSHKHHQTMQTVWIQYD